MPVYKELDTAQKKSTGQVDRYVKIMTAGSVPRDYFGVSQLA
jgi:hypothetical protein